MGNEKQQILSMLAEGKITVDEAERLLDATEGSTDQPKPIEPEVIKTKGSPKSLYIQVNPKNGHSHKGQVNIRVPLMLIKAGVKLGAVMPGKSKESVNAALRDHGLNIDVGNLDSAAMDELIHSLSEASIDIDDEKETVRIYCG
ncbi:MAG: hypothetical protein KKA42_12505 [candidate division Zixibacteria bacterium]|nr:hypothetical protein [candidate division Zixibacteria bacterium]